MLRIEIATGNLADIDEPGQTLARMLRAVADQVETDVRILPTGTQEWIEETTTVVNGFHCTVDRERVVRLVRASVTLLED